MSETARDSRSRILDAAAEVFSSRGYRAGSLNDIAVLAGLTRAGLLHHYRSKEAVLLALLERRDEELAEAGREPDAPATTGADRMRELSAAYRGVLADRTLVRLAHLLTAEASDPGHPAHDWVARRHERFVDETAEILSQCVGERTLAAGTDTRTLSTLILALCEGVENIWLVNPDQLHPATALEALLGLLALE